MLNKAVLFLQFFFYFFGYLNGILVISQGSFTNVQVQISGSKYIELDC